MQGKNCTNCKSFSAAYRAPSLVTHTQLTSVFKPSLTPYFNAWQNNAYMMIVTVSVIQLLCSYFNYYILINNLQSTFKNYIIKMLLLSLSIFSLPYFFSLNLKWIIFSRCILSPNLHLKLNLEHVPDRCTHICQDNVIKWNMPGNHIY